MRRASSVTSRQDDTLLHWLPLVAFGKAEIIIALHPSTSLLYITKCSGRSIAVEIFIGCTAL